MGAVTDALAADSFIKSHPKWKFVFVNHVTTNPFFVPTHLRRAGRVLGARVQLPVDGIADIRHQPDGQRDQRGDLGEGGRHRGLPRRPDGVQRPDRQGARQGHSRSRLQRGRPEQAAGLHRPGSLPVRATTMGQRIVELVASGDVALFIATPGPAQHPAAHRRRQAAIKKFGKGKIKTTSTATGALLPDELAKIDAYYLGHKSVKGMFAVDAGSTQGIGQVMQKYGLAKKGVKAGGYDLNADDPQADPAGRPGLHDRPAAIPAGLAARPPALLLQVLVGARGAVGHEHGHPVRDEGQREAVPDDEDPLRGQLQQAEVSGHAKG